MTPRSLFRAVAVAEALTWALLLAGMYVKYIAQVTDRLVPPAGAVHGFVFLCFISVTLFVWVNQRWSVSTGVLGVASAFVPFATVAFEHRRRIRGQLDGGWRLAPGGSEPQNLPERLQTALLRSPMRAGAAAFAAITVVFVLLLLTGPPVSFT